MNSTTTMNNMILISSTMKNKKKRVGGRKIDRDNIDFVIFYSVLTYNQDIDCQRLALS